MLVHLVRVSCKPRCKKSQFPRHKEPDDVKGKMGWKQRKPETATTFTFQEINWETLLSHQCEDLVFYQI